METIKVMLVDDHVLVRRGIKAALMEQPHIMVVGEAGDGVEALERAAALAPDVVLTDLHMPRMGGLEEIVRLQQELPQVAVLVLTVSEKEEDLFAAIKAGARGYLLKDVEPERLVQAVEMAARGETFFSPLMANKLLAEFQGGATPPAAEAARLPLSPRETEVIQLVAQGMSNKEMAASLFISENTIKTHLKNILEKLHLRSRAQAAAYAARMGQDEK